MIAYYYYGTRARRSEYIDFQLNREEQNIFDLCWQYGVDPNGCPALDQPLSEAYSIAEQILAESGKEVDCVRFEWSSKRKPKAPIMKEQQALKKFLSSLAEFENQEAVGYILKLVVPRLKEKNPWIRNEHIIEILGQDKRTFFHRYLED